MSQTPDANSNGNGKMTMGLSGWLGQIANLTAVTLICLMFYQSQERLWDQNREDRDRYSQELRESHQENAANRAALIKLTESVDDVVREVRQLKAGRP